MSDKVEVTRALLTVLADLNCPYGQLMAAKRQAAEILAAPVVECQRPEKVDHPNFLEFAICDTCAAETLCCEIGPNEHLCGGCYWAPINEKAHADELAELQALSVKNIMLDVVPGFDGMGEEIYAKSVADFQTAMTKLCDEIEKLQDELAECKRDRDTEQRAAIEANGLLKAVKSRNAELVGLLQKVIVSGQLSEPYYQEFEATICAALKPTESEPGQ